MLLYKWGIIEMENIIFDLDGTFGIQQEFHF
jgi:hypothetical protein